MPAPRTAVPGIISLALALTAFVLVTPEPPAAAAADADEVVLVAPHGQWHIRRPGRADYTFWYGMDGDVPLLGDWDGDGWDTPGMYRPSNGFAYLTNILPPDGGVGFAEPALTFYFGAAGDQVVAGDWDGDGIDTLGIRRTGRMYLTNTNETGVADCDFWFGHPADLGFGGDADGDGEDGIFVYRPANSFVYYTDVVPMGSGTVADTSGEFHYGVPTDRFVIGDWDGDGDDTVGVYRPGETRVYLRDTLNTGPADHAYIWGQPSWQPVAGMIGASFAPELPIRINAGGPGISTEDGALWLSDTFADPSPYLNFVAGDIENATVAWPMPELDPSVPASVPPAIFTSERYDESGHRAMHWSLPVEANEWVEVRLYFASGYEGTSDIAERLFDVAIDGWLVLDDYDIVADVGHRVGTMKRAVVKTDADGLDIEFAHTDPAIQNPLINAIEVLEPERLRPVEAAGSALENGAALRRAMEYVATQNPGPNNRWIVKLPPGEYDVGEAPLALVPFVELEGSGETATTILRTQSTPGVSVTDDGVVHGVDHGTLRQLRVLRPAATGERLSSRGIVSEGGAPRIESVTVEVHGHNITAISTQHHADSHLFNVTLHCQGGPSWSSCVEHRNGGTLRASNLTMIGSVGNPGALTGISFAYSPVVISNASIALSGPGVTAAVGSKGTLTVHRSTVSLDGRFRGTMGFAVTIGGLDLRDTTLELRGSHAATTGIDLSIGTATLDRTVIRIASGDSPTGILADNATLVVADSEISAREPVYNTGVGVDLGADRWSTATVIGSSITAPSATVRSAGMVGEIHDSWLIGGPVVGNGSVTCTNVWDEHGAFYPDTCPD